MTAPAKPERQTRQERLSHWPLAARKVRDLLTGDEFACTDAATSACVVVHVEPREPHNVLLVCDAHSGTIYGWEDEVMAVTPPTEPAQP